MILGKAVVLCVVGTDVMEGSAVGGLAKRAHGGVIRLMVTRF